MAKYFVFHLYGALSFPQRAEGATVFLEWKGAALPTCGRHRLFLPVGGEEARAPPFVHAWQNKGLRTVVLCSYLPSVNGGEVGLRGAAAARRCMPSYAGPERGEQGRSHRRESRHTNNRASEILRET